MMILCLFGFWYGTWKHRQIDMVTDSKDTAEISHYQSLAVIDHNCS